MSSRNRDAGVSEQDRSDRKERKHKHRDRDKDREGKSRHRVSEAAFEEAPGSHRRDRDKVRQPWSFLQNLCAALMQLGLQPACGVQDRERQGRHSDGRDNAARERFDDTISPR